MTSDNYERFKDKTAKYFIPGERNSNLLAVAKQAKFYEVDYDEALAYVRSMFGGDFTATDERSFKRAYSKVIADPSFITITQYKEENSKSFVEVAREKKASESKVSSLQAEVNREAAFEEKMSELRKTVDKKAWVEENYKKRSKTSDFMLNVFDERDIVWVSNSAEIKSLGREMKKMGEWAERREPLSGNCFYCINPFLDSSARTKSNVSSFKYMLIESDSLDKDDQLLMLIDLIKHGLPVKMITFSGGKSFHCLVKVPRWISSAEEYEQYTMKIFSKMNWMKSGLVDRKCKNPDRLSRLPFGMRQIEVEDDFGDIQKVGKEQRLIYIAEDDQSSSNDAERIISAWVDGICAGTEKAPEDEPEMKDEVSDGELLWLLKSNDKVIDVWNDGSKVHTLMKAPHFNSDGERVYLYEDKKWDSEAAFYGFAKQELEDMNGKKMSAKDMKDVKALDIRHKVAEKFPYIGKPSHVRRDIVNVFIPGWLGEALKDPSIPAELNEPLEKFLKNIFGDDKEVEDWTLQWMREFMHTFSVMTAPVLWEIPGTGKTMLAKAFGEAIGDWIKTPPKKDDIQFNAWQEHTVIIFEESSSGSKRDGKDLGDLLKDWITETEKTIEAKGKDPVKKTIKSCFIFNANVSQTIAPVFIEDNDRRYTIIRNDEAVNLQTLWTEEDFRRWDSREYQKRLMKWIYNLPKREDINVKRGLDTPWKHEVVEMGKNNIEWAIDQIIETYDSWITATEIMDKLSLLYGVRTNVRAIGGIMKSKGYEQKSTRNHPLYKGISKHAYDLSSHHDDVPEDPIDALIEEA